MTSGNVSIRLSLQDVETVRSGLEKLGNDGQAALKKLEAASLAPSQGLSAVDKAVNDLKSRVEDAGRSLGPLGTLLMGLGPIGIAAAAGLGLVLGIMYEMSKASNELAERSRGIRDFAEATGLTTTQVQALVAEGAKFGLVSEQISGGLQRLSVNLAEAKRGTGALYEDLYRINPQLAHQVAAARNVAEAYDLIGKAIKQASDAQNTSAANQIARAAFGRNPGTQGAMAADVYSSGGVNALTMSLHNAGRALDDGLTKHLAELQVKIQQTEQHTKDLMASMFAEDVLQRTLAAAEAFDRIAMHMVEMNEATKDESWLQYFVRLGAMGSDSAPYDQERLERDTLEQSARRRLQSGLVAGQRNDDAAAKAWQPAGHAQGDDGTSAVAATKKVGDSAEEAKEKLAREIEDTRKWMAVLGSAATPAEQFRLKVMEINLALADHAVNAEKAGRAEQALTNAQAVAQITAREGLGLASQEEIVTAGMIKLREDEAKGFIRSAAEMQQAEERLLRAAQERFNQEQVANSAFKGLTQMSQTNTAADVDQLATGTLNNLTSTAVKATNAVNTLGSAYDTLGQHINATTTNTNAAKQAFIDFARQAIQSIEQVIMKEMILAPLLRSMGFGGASTAGAPLNIVPAGADASLDAGTIGGTAGVLPALMANGGIMTSMGPIPLRRYAGGGVADRPQLAMFGEGRTPEAYVPLPDGRSIPVNLKGIGGGGGHIIHSTTNVQIAMPPGTSPENAHTITKTVVSHLTDMMEQVVDQRIIRHLQSGGMLNL